MKGPVLIYSEYISVSVMVGALLLHHHQPRTVKCCCCSPLCNEQPPGSFIQAHSLYFPTDFRANELMSLHFRRISGQIFASRLIFVDMTPQVIFFCFFSKPYMRLKANQTSGALEEKHQCWWNIMSDVHNVWNNSKAMMTTNMALLWFLRLKLFIRAVGIRYNLYTDIKLTSDVFISFVCLLGWI